MLRKTLLAAAAALSLSPAFAENWKYGWDDPKHPPPHELYQRFRDQWIIGGKCKAYTELVFAVGGPFNREQIKQSEKILRDCWLDFISPRS